MQQPVNSSESTSESPKENRSTRLVSADAYRSSFTGGIRAMELLDRIRRSPLTASSPEAGIDLERVGFHAAQAVAFGLVLTAASFILMLLHANAIGYFRFYGPINGFINYVLNHLSFFVPRFGFGPQGGEIFLLLFAALFAFETMLILWYFQVHHFKRENYDPNFSLPLPDSLASFFRAYGGPTDPNQNVVVFGGFQPFVGGGATLSDWQFVMDLSRQAENGSDEPVKPISLAQIYDRIDRAIQDRGLPFLRVQDRLFVNGDGLAADGLILPRPDQRPIAHLDPTLIEQAREDTRVASERRIYRAYTYEDKAHDTVTSAFLHVARYGNNLYVEAAFRVLLPINEHIYNIDRRLEPTMLRRILLALALTALYFLFPLIPIIALAARLATLIRYLWKWYQEDRRQRNTAKRNIHIFNYGVTQTFRESVAYTTFASYFAMKDTVTYWKALEECFIEALLDELEDSGIDVGKLRQSVGAYFVNNGVVQTGGTMSASQLSIGQGAQNIFNPAAPSTGGNLLQRAGNAAAQGISRATGGPSAG